MNPTCQAVCECPVPTTPGIGFTTENFVAPVFVAVATGPNIPPPLGYEFANPTRTEPGHSAVSQEEAEFEAWLAASRAARAGWVSPADWKEPTPDLGVEPITVDFDAPQDTPAPIEPIF